MRLVDSPCMTASTRDFLLHSIRKHALYEFHVKFLDLHLQ